MKPLALPLAALLVACPSLATAAEPIPLRAGPLDMLFDADLAFLRYVKVGPHEVLRGINAPIRNEVWGTVAPKVFHLVVNDGGDHFEVTFDVVCREKGLDFRWKGSLTGTAQGEVTFTFDGEAHTTFKRNRIGFCVLHGPSAAGQPWTLETVDSKKSKGKFPTFISPHQPAKNLKAIVHEVADGIHARVEFEGEVFEMEDQRNWTDASFKTYCIPLEIPYPVEVPKGTKISQKVTFRVDGDLPAYRPPGSQRLVLTLGEKRTALPRLGVQVSKDAPELTDRQVDRLKALQLDHLRVDLALSEDSFVKDLRLATAQARALGVSLHAGLVLGENPAFEKLVAAVKELKSPVAFWLVTGGKPADFKLARQHLKPLAGKARIGVTRRTNFVDLNRERPTDKAIEAVSFAINPQIHAFDNASMVETLPIQGDAVRTTRQFAGDLPLVIGPMTLRPRQSNGGPPPGALPTDVDVRQPTAFTAAWTLGSVKFLAEAGAHSATYFETAGWKGVMDADNVKGRPAAFPSRPGRVFDLYEVLRDIGEFAGGEVQQIDSSHDLEAVGLALRKPGRLRVLIANLTPKMKTLSLRGLGNSIKVQLLNSKNGLEAAPELPIKLPPFGIARIDGTED